MSTQLTNLRKRGLAHSHTPLITMLVTFAPNRTFLLTPSMPFVQCKSFSGGKLIYRGSVLAALDNRLLSATDPPHSTKTDEATHPGKSWPIADGSTSALRIAFRHGQPRLKKICPASRDGRCSKSGGCGSPK